MNKIKALISRLNIIVKIFIVSLPVFLSIGFVEKQQGEQDCRRIVVKVENTLGNYFIEEKDIINMVTHQGHQSFIGKSFKSIDMKAIEKDVNELKFVKNAQVYRDLKGNLIVSVEQQRPIARLVRPLAPDAYISEDGTILPTSGKYSARAIIIRGDYTDKIISEGLTVKNRGTSLLKMLKYIDKNAYWRALIAEIAIDRYGNMVLYPQVGKQEFIFGNCDEFETKFNKIQTFYDKIRPAKGWNHYARVNIKYKNQIICE